jgi:hypothetical protein
MRRFYQKEHDPSILMGCYRSPLPVMFLENASQLSRFDPCSVYANAAMNGNGTLIMIDLDEKRNERGNPFFLIRCPDYLNLEIEIDGCDAPGFFECPKRFTLERNILVQSDPAAGRAIRGSS